MRKIALFLIVFLSVSLYSQEYANDRIIVQLKKDLFKQVENLSELQELNFLFEQNTISEIKPLDISKSKSLNGRPLVIVFNQAVEVERLIRNLKQTNVFEYVEFDFIAKGSGILIQNESIVQTSLAPLAVTPNDQYFFRQWGLYNDGSFSATAIAGADVKMKDAWDLTTGSSDIVMAVIDSGIRMNHPEFSGRFWINQNEQYNGLDDDGNGYIDDIYGWDFVNNDNDPTDDHGHGTNVTGIAVANGNNGIGYAGADWNCKLLSLKALDNNNSGYNSYFIAAIYYAINRDVDVISMSIGGTGYSQVYHNAVIAAYNANIPFIACMMNFNNNVSYYPAAFSEVIAVGSTDPNDYRTAPFFWSPTSGSNYGNHIDVVAPGNFIYGLSHTSDTNYDSYWGGTSQATPLVAGIVTLMLSLDSTLTVEQIRSVLRDTAQDQVGKSWEDTLGFDQYHGAGRVNAYQVLLAVQSLSIEPETDTLFDVYPNPTTGILNFSENIKSINIYDVSGRFIKKFENISNQVDISQFSQGMYLIESHTFDNQKHTKKVIKE